MAPVLRTDRNQEFDGKGRLVRETIVQTDVTADAVLFDLATKARAALDANATFLAIGSPTNAQVLAQVQRLTRECSALIRLQARTIAGLEDLALDVTGT